MAPPNVDVKLLKRRQVAELLAVSERTVLRLTAKGILPTPVRIGRAVRWPEAKVLDAIRQLSDSQGKPREQGATVT